MPIITEVIAIDAAIYWSFLLFEYLCAHVRFHQFSEIFHINLHFTLLSTSMINTAISAVQRNKQNHIKARAYRVSQLTWNCWYLYKTDGKRSMMKGRRIIKSLL